MNDIDDEKRMMRMAEQYSDRRIMVKRNKSFFLVITLSYNKDVVVFN